ncbi:hypothetical protein BDW74DRAFT_164064 [Aspergillus multicolor]|uniref:uncharacterized protein n=1 Tax=Aspergillus multicolor TaxID=41759 RepID=UPI003CCDA069
MGAEKSVLLSKWPGVSGPGGAITSTASENKTHWVTSFVALQADVPVKQLEGYGSSTQGQDASPSRVTNDAYGLSRNFLTTFLDARTKGVEAFFLDRDVPQLSFTPGSLLFGRGGSMGAFMLGSWSSSRGLPLHRPILSARTPHPVSDFPSNKSTLCVTTGTAPDTAGSLIYWRFPRGFVDTVNEAASYGLPWRLMDGGFQEFIVERISDETARVTYITIECGDMYPGGQEQRDFKKSPWFMYELHVVYAQVLLWRTLRGVNEGQ